MSSIKIMLVEDHPEYRETLEFVLNKESDIHVSCRFGNAEMALRSLQDEDNEVDIILLDLNLPGMSGLEAMPLIYKHSPDKKVIILSQSDMEADVLRAVQQGATGYLLKSASMDEIKQGIRTVMNGGATLEPSLARFVLTTLQHKLPTTQSIGKLSDRELEVLTLIGEGLAQKQISEQLDISHYTVTDHLKHIYLKLNVPNAPAAVDVAHRFGIFKNKK